MFVEAIKKNLQHVNVLPDELKDELRKVTAIYAEGDLHMNVTVPGSSLYFLLGCFQDIIGDAQILKITLLFKHYN